MALATAAARGVSAQVSGLPGGDRERFANRWRQEVVRTASAQVKRLLEGGGVIGSGL
jgi:hypothetical protein